VPHELRRGRCNVFFPGSSIGNFAPDAARDFLAQIYAITRSSDGVLLIGVDAKKEKAILDAAYDDALGVTSAFNLNALRHINRVADSNFSLADWRHSGNYNQLLGRVEMHLEARRAHEVVIGGNVRHFAAGERIHSESSYKYDRDEFEALLRSAGFAQIQCWTDHANAFWVFGAR